MTIGNMKKLTSIAVTFIFLSLISACGNNLSADQISKMTEEQLKQITPDQIGKMTPGEIEVFKNRRSQLVSERERALEEKARKIEIK